ncbi:MAG: ferritin family protein [Spirochaetota bacterium]|nr:MAG: ferritin family protein [Spirochaetota bacterium]
MKLKEAFTQAMKSEIEGRELYKVASERSEDPKAKEVFSYLSKEEDSHYHALRELYGSYVNDEKIVLKTLPRLARFEDAESPIFSRDFKNRLAGKHFEMSALSIAIKLEYDAIRFYKGMAESTDDKNLREFFLELSNWEQTHYDALNKEISFLQDEYFEKNNFAPFL